MESLPLNPLEKYKLKVGVLEYGFQFLQQNLKKIEIMKRIILKARENRRKQITSRHQSSRTLTSLAIRL